MKLTVIISEGPYTHEASDTAYNLVQAAIKMGHEIKGIFFYNDGTYNATRFMEPPQDDRHISKRWMQLGGQGIDIVVCIAAGLKRGIVDKVTTDNIRISGLGQLAKMIMESDRTVVFGD